MSVFRVFRVIRLLVFRVVKRFSVFRVIRLSVFRVPCNIFRYQTVTSLQCFMLIDKEIISSHLLYIACCIIVKDEGKERLPFSSIWTVALTLLDD
jgi:hypothetical protein